MFKLCVTCFCCSEMARKLLWVDYKAKGLCVLQRGLTLMWLNIGDVFGELFGSAKV